MCMFMCAHVCARVNERYTGNAVLPFHKVKVCGRMARITGLQATQAMLLEY